MKNQNKLFMRETKYVKLRLLNRLTTRKRREKFLFTPSFLVLDSIQSFFTENLKIVDSTICQQTAQKMKFCITVCNFQSMKSTVELNRLFLKFFCYITWFVISPDQTPTWMLDDLQTRSLRQILAYLRNNSIAI